MTHATLLKEFKRAVRDSNAAADDFDYFANITLPTFLRMLYKWELHHSHIRFLPKLILTLSEDTWQYDWLSVAKYSNTSLDITSGVSAAITGVKSTYFIAPGDILTYDSTDYQIIDFASTTITIATSVTDTAKAGYVYARPLFFTDAYLLEADGEAGTDEIPIRRSKDMVAPNRNNNEGMRHPLWRQRGDKVEISWNPEGSDKLHLFYIPEPVAFDNTNSLMTALTNPTQLTDEGNRALVWAMGENYWMQKGQKDEVMFCNSMYKKILDTAGAFNGQPGW